MTLEAGSIVGGKYELDRPLARGGMGSVWIATHQQLRTEVAVKFMDPKLVDDEDARGRFEREARAAATLRSPHVVQIFDYGVEAGAPYLVMELLKGNDLRSRLAKRGKLPLDEACIILTQACKALQLAGEMNIVHRDLKPGNIYLARSGKEEVVKILDFGLAKPVRNRHSDDDTTSGVLLGSPNYMSPEQVRGGILLDHRSDLWSLAVILFQMLVGHKPFPAREFGETLLQICSDPLPIPTDFDDSLPPAIDTFFKRAFARDREKRFGSAVELGEQFAAVVAEHLNRPELATPSSTGLTVRSESDIPPSQRVNAFNDDTAPDITAKTKVSGPNKTVKVAEVASGTFSPATHSTLRTQKTEYSHGLRGRKARWALGAAVALVGGVVVAYLAFFIKPGPLGEPSVAGIESSPAATGETMAPESSTSVAPAQMRTVRLAIDPANAIVQIDDQAVQPQDGFVELTGRLGSKHSVLLKVGDEEKKVDVFITEDGALPAKLVLTLTKGKQVPAKPTGVLPGRLIAKPSKTGGVKPASPRPPAAKPASTPKKPAGSDIPGIDPEFK